ncbi:MAG: DUF3999 domain-containing protein [Alphaproteobacteria bacterium]|nr:DUF3999 domain-containing protein [Alphaproteobacteria bacterium]
MTRAVPLVTLALVTLLTLITPALSTDATGEPQLTHQFALEVARPAAYYTLAVPAEVYAASQRDDLGDIRVLNGAGERVPYSLEAPRESERPADQRTVKWFPVNTRAIPDAPLDLTLAPDGSLRPSAGRTPPGARGHDTDIVDTGASPAALAALVVHLDGIFQGHVRVDASDDLRNWRFVTNASLLNLILAGETLSQERIPLGQLHARYLRLTWRDGVPAIASMVAEEATALPFSTQPPRQWRDIETRAGKAPGEYFFTTDAAYPIDLLRLELPQPNTVARLMVSSRHDAQEPWLRRAQTVVYRLQSKAIADREAEQISPPLPIERSTDREWRIDVDMRGGGLGAGALKATAGWYPKMLTFVARGTAPFTLAVGNSSIGSNAVSRSELMIDADSNLAEARVGALLRAAAPQSLTEPPPDSDSRRRSILWVALTLAVGVLGLMAWILARQPSQTGEA